MEATCPCHRIFSSAFAYHRHLVYDHQANSDQAFLITQAAILGWALQYVVDGEGDILLAGLQLPMLPE